MREDHRRHRTRRTLSSQRGMSLIEVMMTTLVMTIMYAIAVPAGKAALDSLELGTATREVERELQTARLRAVSANRPMRLKLNCPNDGEYRLVEVTGVVATDNAESRCDETLYGYPGPNDNDPATPEHDGPLRRVSSEIDTFTGPELEFSPDGTTRLVVNGVPQTLNGVATVQLGREGAIEEITVNALGRISLDR